MSRNALQAFHSKQSLTTEVINVLLARMSEEKLSEQLSFRVSPTLYRLIEQIAKAERRKPNEVARALLERGAAAYQRDGEIFETDEERSEDFDRAMADQISEAVQKRGQRKSESEPEEEFDAVREATHKRGQKKVADKTRRSSGTVKR
jgi:hypothetical protein